jgi:hypothetical protein
LSGGNAFSLLVDKRLADGALFIDLGALAMGL